MDIRPLSPPAEHRAAPAGVRDGASPSHRAARSIEEGAERGNGGVENTLDQEERRQVAELRATDRRVRAHEAAHVAAAGQYAQGGASFEFQTGPDGKRYAVGGEVAINAAPVGGDPQATLRKMEQVRRAALAPADPSPQDRRVAAEAARHASAARLEMMAERPAARPLTAAGTTDTAPATAIEPGAATEPPAIGRDPRDRAPRHGYDAHAADLRQHRAEATPGLRLDRTA